MARLTIDACDIEAKDTPDTIRAGKIVLGGVQLENGEWVVYQMTLCEPTHMGMWRDFWAWVIKYGEFQGQTFTLNGNSVARPPVTVRADTVAVSKVPVEPPAPKPVVSPAVPPQVSPRAIKRPIEAPMRERPKPKPPEKCLPVAGEPLSDFLDRFILFKGWTMRELAERFTEGSGDWVRVKKDLNCGRVSRDAAEKLASIVGQGCTSNMILLATALDDGKGVPYLDVPEETPREPAKEESKPAVKEPIDHVKKIYTLDQYDTLFDFIKHLADQRRMSIEQLAKKSGMAPSTIHRVARNGGRVITTKMIARGLEIKEDILIVARQYFLEREDITPPFEYQGYMGEGEPEWVKGSRYLCKKDGMTFTNAGLHAHRMKKHDGAEAGTLPLEIIGEGVPEGFIPYLCETCTMPFASPNRRERHGIKVRHEVVPPGKPSDWRDAGGQ